MRAIFPLVVAQRFQKRRDFGAVDVISPALALRLEHVARRLGLGCRERDGVFTRGRGVEGVDGCEGVLDAGSLIGGGVG